MGKTFILGDESLRDFAEEKGLEYIPYPELRLSSHEGIHDYMVECFQGQDVDMFILDAESDLAFSLDLAMHIRLSLDALGDNALAPIVFISELAIDALLKLNENSQIFLTANIYLSPASKLTECLNNASRMRLEDYQRDFLNKITINPPISSTTGRHGLANQWGAGVMYRILEGHQYHGDECPELVRKQKDIYFKYILATTVDDIQTLVIPEKKVLLGNNLPILSTGRRILLIDDMADMGWSLAIKKFFPGAQIDVISRSVTDIEQFSDDEKRMVLQDDYDLYLLDLRLGGDKEEYIYETSAFSGMKVLKKIKEENRGRQVIMFTASNKVWNFKQLLDPGAGANGYYIKEAPSFKFSESFSRKSLEAFRDEAESCFRRNYLKGFSEFITHTFPPETGNELFDECGFQMGLAFNLADAATDEAQFQYAFIALFQVLEILTKYILSTKDEDGKRIMRMRTQDEMAVETVRNIHEDSLNSLLYVQDDHLPFEKGEKDSFSKFEQLAAIYLQYLGQKDEGILYILDQLIKNRNRVMHGTLAEQQQDDAKSKVLSEKDFKEKFLPYMPAFSSEEGLSLIDELLRERILRTFRKDKAPVLILSKHVVNQPIGIKLLLFCLKSFFNSFR